MRTRSQTKLITKKASVSKTSTVVPSASVPSSSVPNGVVPNGKMVTRSQTFIAKPSIIVPTENNHVMVTRSKVESPNSNNSVIDFDESSKAWRANKVHVGNGQFEYIGMRTRSSKNLA